MPEFFCAIIKPGQILFAQLPYTINSYFLSSMSEVQNLFVIIVSVSRNIPPLQYSTAVDIQSQTRFEKLLNSGFLKFFKFKSFKRLLSMYS